MVGRRRLHEWPVPLSAPPARSPRVRGARAFALVGVAVLIGACGAKDATSTSGGSASTSVGSTVTVATELPPTTRAPTTTPTPATTPTALKPSCTEVDAAVASMSPADREVLRKAMFVSVTRLPGQPGGFRFTALGDVTGKAPRPDVAVYYDWTPATGLGPPVVVADPQELKVLQGSDTSVALMGLRCTNVTTNFIPAG